MSVIIPGYPKSNSVHFTPKCKKIIQHRQHAYNERGQVIVVDADKEDRQAYINSFKDETGLKNVIKQLIKTGDRLGWESMAYNGEKEAVDVSGVPTNVNDLVAAASTSDATAVKALADFNKACGTNLTLDEFIAKSSDGTLLDYVASEMAKASKPTEEGDK